MKNQYAKYIKSHAQSGGYQKDMTSKTTMIPQGIKIDESPVKVGEPISSARNSKAGGTITQFVYEPVKSRSFVSSIISPGSKRPLLNGLSSTEGAMSLQKLKDKNYVETLLNENNNTMHRSITSHHITNNYDTLKNKLMSKTAALKDSVKGSVDSINRKNYLAEKYNPSSVVCTSPSLEMTNTDSITARKPSAQRDILETSPEPKATANISYKILEKQNQRGEKLIVNGTSLNFNSPKRLLDNEKSANIPAKSKNDFLLSRIISDHLKKKNIRVNDSEEAAHLSTSASQNFKGSSIIKNSNSIVTNNANSILFGGSQTSKRQDSRSSKDNSYIKDSSISRYEDKKALTGAEKQSNRSTDEFLNKYYKKIKERPDDSSERHNLNSVRSLDFIKSASPRADQKSVDNRILAAHFKDVPSIEDRGNILSRNDYEGSRKGLNFHHSLTEHSAEKGASHNNVESSSSILSRLSKHAKPHEEEKKNPNVSTYKRILELMSASKGNLNIEALVSPKASRSNNFMDFNKKSSLATYNPQEIIKTEDATVHDEPLFKRYPKSTKHSEIRNFKASFESSVDAFRSRIFNQSKDDQNENHLFTNKSLTLASDEKVNEFLQKARKSRVLLNNEIEEKIAQLEKRRLDLCQNYQNAENLELLDCKPERDTDHLRIEPYSLNSTKRNTPSKMQKENEAVVPENQLTGIYNKVKEELSRHKSEKMIWISEKQQLLDRIALLEKKVSDLESMNKDHSTT